MGRSDDREVIEQSCAIEPGSFEYRSMMQECIARRLERILQLQSHG